MMRRSGLLKVALIALTWASAPAYPQEKQGRLPNGYPVKPIRVLVGVSPGGGLDAITRIVAQKLSERLGHSVIVDNRPGAASMIAMDIAARAGPDGYTLMSATKTMILHGATKRVPYDVLTAYEPIAQMSTQVYVLVVHTSLPIKSVRDLLAYATSEPGHVTYGSAGVGSLQHVGMELFKSMARVNMLHVPYKGGGAAIIDLLAGQIHLMPSVTITVAPHVKSGKLRAIAVTGLQRVQIFAHVPTVSESGVPGFELANMYGLYAPARTPRAIISSLNRVINQIMTLPELKNTLAADGVEAAAPSTSEEFKDTVVRELRKWEEFIKKSKLEF